jgi:integrase
MAVTKTKTGKWQATFRGPDGRERQKTFARKLDAQRWERDQRTDVGRGEYVERGRDRHTIGDLVTLYRASIVHVTPKTRERYEGICDSHVLPKWGSRRPSTITHTEAQQWIADLMEQGQEPASVRKIAGVFKRVLDRAVRDRQLDHNPARGLNLPRVKPAKHRYLTHEQVAHLAAPMSSRDALIVELLAYTGLRWGELAPLRVGDVNFLRKRIEVTRAVTLVRGRLVMGVPKDHEMRSVPIPAHLIDALAAHCTGRGSLDLLIPTKHGTILRAQTFARVALTPAATGLGLDGLHVHELRHTAASLAISAGANPKAVQNMLGHASAAMTLDTYADLFDDDLDVVAEAMDAARTRSLADFSRTLGVPTPMHGTA